MSIFKGEARSINRVDGENERKCEGCGAMLTLGRRTCQKCGRWN